jgi:hypothetical protein
VIEVSDRVPRECAHLVVRGRRTDDNRMCTLGVIHKCSEWAVHGLGNPGVRLTTLGIAALAETSPMRRTTADFQAGQTGDAGRPEPVADLASHSRTKEPAIKPLIYGYVRVTEALGDDEFLQLECGLGKLAEAEGYCLTETYYEYQPGYYGTFYRLIAELKRTQARHVVVLSLDHLSTHPLLRGQMILRLHEVNARDWLVEP